MEIGVADGENAREMLRVASQNSPAQEVEYYGFDIFGGIGGTQMEHVSRKLEKTGCRFTLYKGDSVRTLPKMAENLSRWI